MPGRFESLLINVWKIFLYKKTAKGTLRFKLEKHRGFDTNQKWFFYWNTTYIWKKCTNHQFTAQWKSTKATVQSTPRWKNRILLISWKGPMFPFLLITPPRWYFHEGVWCFHKCVLISKLYFKYMKFTLQ